MRVYTNFEKRLGFPRPLVLALGFFDGLHLGHQKILSQVIRSAEFLRAAPAVVTFQEHPQKVLRPDLPSPAMLTSFEQKLILIERSGIEFCFALPFTKEFSEIHSDDFVQLLLDRLGMKKMCLGYNAHFGKDRRGNVETMKILSQAWNFSFEEVGPVMMGTEPVSSSRIRKLMEIGDLDEASKCLGRRVSLVGNVVKGEGRGRQIGFPTANVEAGFLPSMPYGVYPVRLKRVDLKASSENEGAIELETKLQDDYYQGVMNYGLRPTFKNGQIPFLEVHLLDFDGDLYHKTFEILIYPLIRKEVKFDGVEALKEQIIKDIQAARRYLGDLAPDGESGPRP